MPLMAETLKTWFALFYLSAIPVRWKPEILGSFFNTMLQIGLVISIFLHMDTPFQNALLKKKFCETKRKTLCCCRDHA